MLERVAPGQLLSVLSPWAGAPERVVSVCLEAGLKSKPAETLSSMKKIHIFPAGAALTMAACGDPLLAPPSAPVLPSAQAWNIQYSPGMPPHPIAVDGGWYFDFPAPNCGRADVCSVHYVTTPVKMSLATSGRVRAMFRVTASDRPVFNYRLSPDNTCNYPAHARFYLQRAGDDLSGQGEYEFYRWFSNDVAYELAAGSANLIAALTPEQWTSVFGKKGDYDSPAMAGFAQALRHLGHVGVVFGGGCYYGHGVNVSGGTARFTLREYSIAE